MTTIKLDAGFSGRTLSVAPGDQLDLHLQENPTTGFRWHVEDDYSGVLLLERDNFTRFLSGISGGGGMREFVFKVAKPGQAALRACHRRSWEKQTPPQAIFELTVTAQ